MAQSNLLRKIVAALTGVGAVGVLIGAVALAFAANNTTPAEQPRAKMPSRPKNKLKNRKRRKPHRARKISSPSRIKNLKSGKSVTGAAKPTLKKAPLTKKRNRPYAAPTVGRPDLKRGPDPTRLRMRRTSEMTPEERQQRRIERRKRQAKNLQRRIKSLEDRIQQSKSDGTRSEKQIERMERSLERMMKRSKRLDESLENTEQQEEQLKE